MEPTLTASDMTPVEEAAWKVAIDRGLSITRYDLRLLLEAAKTEASTVGVKVTTWRCPDYPDDE